MAENADGYGWRHAGEHFSHDYLLGLVRKLLPESSELQILDAGCGSGYIAAALADDGHDVTGIDASADGIALAREAYPQVRYEAASVYDDFRAFAPKGGWDVIVAVEVIEHLYSPRRFLENVRRHLRSSGHLIITTPYHGYLKNLAISIAGGWDRHFGVHWEGGHIKFFSVNTLRGMLEGAGFCAPEFRFAGRAPLLWRSMACRVQR